MKWKLIAMALVCAICVGIGYNAGYNAKLAEHQSRITALEARNDLLRDTVIDTSNQLLDVTRVENARAAGRLEALALLNFPDFKGTTQASMVWHEGYNRGLEQVEYVGTSNYERGYHAALKDSGCPDGTKANVFIPKVMSTIPVSSTDK